METSLLINLIYISIIVFRRGSYSKQADFGLIRCYNGFIIYIAVDYPPDEEFEKQKTLVAKVLLWCPLPLGIANNYCDSL